MDEGAYKAIRKADSGGRLLPAGVIGVEGNWERMQAVKLLVRKPKEGKEGAWEDVEVGRGLANYTSIECERIKGLKR